MRNVEEILNNRQLKILTTHTDVSDPDFIRISAEFTEPVSLKRYYVIFTSSLGWEHASVSQNNKTPTWDIMCRVKDIFWNDDECCVEYHPKKEDYVNMHEHCLHIWKPIGVELPTPPSIMIGLKGVNSEQAQLISKAFINSLSDEDIKRIAANRGIRANRDLRRGNR